MLWNYLIHFVFCRSFLEMIVELLSRLMACLSTCLTWKQLDKEGLKNIIIEWFLLQYNLLWVRQRHCRTCALLWKWLCACLINLPIVYMLVSKATVFSKYQNVWFHQAAWQAAWNTIYTLSACLIVCRWCLCNDVDVIYRHTHTPHTSTRQKVGIFCKIIIILLTPAQLF